MGKPVCSFVLALYFLSSCAVGEPARQTGAGAKASTRETTGEEGGVETLSALEAKGQEAEKKSNWNQAGEIYHQAAARARIIGQYQRAISNANKALELNERAGNLPRQGWAIIELVFAYRLVGQRAKNEALFEKGIEIVKQIALGTEKTDIEAFMYGEFGTEFLFRGKTQQAIEYISHALQVYESRLVFLKRSPAGNAQAIRYTLGFMVVTLQRLGRAYQSAGQVDDATKVYERALSIIKETGLTTHVEGSLYRQVGELYLGQKDFERALESLTTAVAGAEKFQDALGIQEANRLIASLLHQTSEPSEAIPYYKKAIESIESTRSLLDSEEYRTSFFSNKGDAYSGMIQAQLGVKNFADAFNYSERARSRSFLDILASKVQLARSGTLIEYERALQARISVLRAMMEGDGSESEQAPQLRKELDGAQKDYNDYLAKLRKENKEQASLMSVEPLTLKQVQERLDPGVTMLEYFVTSSSVYLWVVEKDRVQFVSTSIARKDLVSKVTELRDTIYQLGEKERFNALSQELHKILLQPALSHIRGKELIIVPHDVLHYLPFQALLGTDNRYLIEKYPIYYLSSASLMQFTQEKRRAMGEKVLAFGNPELDDPKMALRFAEIEAGEIKKLYPQSTVLLKKEATEEKAKTLSPDNDIVHFASHAELNEDDPLASAILLTKGDKEDGRLEVREIFGMDLIASLVVLSACETGLGKFSSGDELVGLTRAFIYAGTPSVVASLWSVDDSSTAQLMASFYKNLKTMTKVEALRQAQLNLIRGNVNSDSLARRGIGGVGKLGDVPAAKFQSQDSISISTSHPYFWAPFILVGEGK